VRKIQRTSAGSTSENRSSKNSIRFVTMPVSTITGSGARIRSELWLVARCRPGRECTPPVRKGSGATPAGPLPRPGVGLARRVASRAGGTECHGVAVWVIGGGVRQPPTLAGPPLADASGIGALTLGGLLGEQGARFADREALVFDDPLLDGATVRWTYADLLHNSRRVAKALLATGVGKGAHVGVLMGNRPEAVAALL